MAFFWTPRSFTGYKAASTQTRYRHPAPNRSIIRAIDFAQCSNLACGRRSDNSGECPCFGFFPKDFCPPRNLGCDVDGGVVYWLFRTWTWKETKWRDGLRNDTLHQKVLFSGNYFVISVPFVFVGMEDSNFAGLHSPPLDEMYQPGHTFHVTKCTQLAKMCGIWNCGWWLSEVGRH